AEGDRCEKLVRDQGDRLSGSKRGDVDNALADAKKALESNDKAQMDKARESLTAAAHKLAEQMYKAAQPAGGAQAGPGAGPSAGPEPDADGGGQKKDEGGIDAEYVDVEPKK